MLDGGKILEGAALKKARKKANKVRVDKKLMKDFEKSEEYTKDLKGEK